MNRDEMQRDAVKRNASLEKAELTPEQKAWVEDYERTSPDER
jgi:molybdopterin synthase catalytic subunit